MIKGEVSNKTPVIEGNPITSINEKLVNYLGKKYYKTLKEKEQIGETVREVKKFEKDIKMQGTRKIEGMDGKAQLLPGLL